MASIKIKFRPSATAVRERIRLDTERLADERPPPRVRPPAVHPVPLTLYVARHSWASAARSKGIPLSVISEGMGHDSEATTRIYFATLDTAAVDRANTLILDSLT